MKKIKIVYLNTLLVLFIIYQPLFAQSIQVSGLIAAPCEYVGEEISLEINKNN